MKTYYVYQYKDPLTHQPFYIGKGTAKRMLVHLSETYENTDNVFKWAYIQGLYNKGLQPLIEKVMDGISEDEAYAFETELIKKYGRKGIDPDGILTNRCLDNRPPTKYGKDHHQFGKAIPVPDENKRRQNISKAKKGKPNGQKGLKKSETMRQRLSASRTGVGHSEETKLKIAESGSGPANSQYGSFWITDGNQNKKIRNIEDMPEGWYKGRAVNHIVGFRGAKHVR
jgi:hypothetical protein